MSTAKKEYKRITTKTLVEMKKQGVKIAMLTAYDYTMAKIVDHAGIDIILVGDSASNVMAGHETTLPITLDQMIYHTNAVCAGAPKAFVILDMPFGTYINKDDALSNAVKVDRDTNCAAIKIEGGEDRAHIIEHL